jgi:8-oxo-dGTP pyrophosphatase MutT (NUDIX family)
MSAGVLFADEAGRVLMVRPTYKEYWDIPGGYVEPGESPYAACIREVREELAIAPPIAPQPLVIDWAPADGEGDKVLFVFAGSLDGDTADRIAFADGELSEARFVDPPELDQYTVARLARRLRSAIDAFGTGRTVYLEHGMPTKPAPPAS